MDSSKVKVSGPGVGSGVRANIPQSFTVDCRKAGVAPLAVAVTAPKGAAVPVEVTNNGDGTHMVSYTPTVEGPHSVAVKYAEEDIPRRYRAVLHVGEAIVSFRSQLFNLKSKSDLQNLW